MSYPTKQDVIQALQKLGSSPVEIRTKLNELGCKGRREAPCNCPISNYLARSFPTQTNIPTKYGSQIFAIRTDVRFIRIIPVAGSNHSDVMINFEKEGLPHFYSFIHDFDNHLYPELEY